MADETLSAFSETTPNHRFNGPEKFQNDAKREEGKNTKRTFVFTLETLDVVF